MTTRYSKKTGGFYPAYIDYGDSLPDDLVEISDEEHAGLLAGNAAGQDIVGDDAGSPVLQDRAAASFDAEKLAYLDTVREMREKILNRLMGIGFAAFRTGDTATSDACDAARVALLEIIQAPAVSAATNMAELKEAVLGSYREIVTHAPGQLKTVFNGVDR